jgi:hypothetical protein
LATVLACAGSSLVAHAQPAAPARVLGPSGEAMPVGNLPGWRQTFTDDFTTGVRGGDFPDAVSSKWDAYPSPWKDTTGNGTYSPERVVSITDGMLDQHIRTVGGTSLVAALLPKIPGLPTYGQEYGRYAVRFRSDRLPGYKIAWMLWPDGNNNLRDGEIDFPEKDLDTPNVYGFVHYTDSNDTKAQGWAIRPMDINQWHTAVIAWTPGLVRFLLDDVEIGRTSGSRVPDTPMHWVLQTETSLTSGKPAASVDGFVHIDWVAAWSYAPDSTPPKVSVGSLTANQTVTGDVRLTATASDLNGIKQMKWYVDGTEVGWDGGGAPWSDTWDTGDVRDGAHHVWAKALDWGGNWGTSKSVLVYVNNV